MRIHELKRRLREAGAGPSHEQRIVRLWSHSLPRNSGRRLPVLTSSSCQPDLPEDDWYFAKRPMLSKKSQTA